MAIMHADARVELVEQFDLHVRDLVRRQGVDPQSDPLVVHLGVDVNGVRRVDEIVGVPGRVENDIIETESVFERSGGELRRSNGTAPRPELYERVGIDVHHILNGSR